MQRHHNVPSNKSPLKLCLAQHPLLPRRPKESGIALLLTLLVLTILIVIIGQLSFTSTQNTIVAENFNNDLQNWYGVSSGYQHGILYLQDDIDRASNTVDSFNEEWAKPHTISVGNAAVAITIEDEHSKINLSLLYNSDGGAYKTTAEKLKRLITNSGYEEKYADMITDYIDKDANGNYELNAKNSQIINLEELLRIDELLPDILYGGIADGVSRKGIMPFITTQRISQITLPDGKTLQLPPLTTININTAPAEVFMSLSPDITQEIANNIITYRQTVEQNGQLKEFRSVDELKNVQGITDEILNAIRQSLTVKSNFFCIKAKSAIGNLEKVRAYTVYRDTNAKVVHLVTSQTVKTFLSIKPETTK